MPIVSGDFTASQLVQTQVRADAMFTNDMMKADFEANTKVWDGIKAEMNANVSILEGSEKDRDVKIHWINACGDTVSDCDGDDCDLEGAELGTDSQVYSLEQCKQYKFTVDEMLFRQNDYSMEEVVAKGFLKADKALSETIARGGVAALESFKGTNTVTNGPGTVNGVTTETDIAAADWNARLFAYLYRVGIQNEMSNPFLMSGEALWEERFLAMQYQANGEGKGDANMFKLIRTYFDLFNIDPINAPDLKAYLINRGSVAFASKNYYGAVPTTYIGAGQQRYSIASRNLPGVRFDVFYTNRCTATTMKHDFKLIAKYDYFLNPTGCDAGRTGVLAFNKTA